MCECMANISPSESMSENVKITRAETMSPNFRHIVIPTHQNVEMSRAETMCTFSLRFFCILQICKGSVTYRHTDRQTDGQSLLEDASRIKNHRENPGVWACVCV